MQGRRAAERLHIQRILTPEVQTGYKTKGSPPPPLSESILKAETHQ